MQVCENESEGVSVGDTEAGGRENECYDSKKSATVIWAYLALSPTVKLVIRGTEDTTIVGCSDRGRA